MKLDPKEKCRRKMERLQITQQTPVSYANKKKNEDAITDDYVRY